MRAVPEWVGKHDDSRIPDRVRLRIFLQYAGRCQCGCARLIRIGEPWDLDHRQALINGGEHRESNLVPLLKEHHKNKSKQDVAEKSKTYQMRRRHYGIKKSRGKPMLGTKASGWKRKVSGGWERR